VKVLVTGVSGQVGGDLRRQLLGRVDVAFADRAAMDLSSEESITRVLDREAPDVVVNPAAYTAVDAAEDHEAPAMAINATAPGVIANWLQARGGFLIHFSTDYVYDGTKPQPYVEDDRTSPLSVYGRSKLAGEEAVRGSGVEHFIFRTSWVYSSSGKNFLLTMLRLFAERVQLSVVADQVGAPTYSLDIARFISECALPSLSASTRPASGVYHLTAEGETSWHGFAMAILEKASRIPPMAAGLRVQEIRPISTSQYPTRAVRPGNSRLNSSKTIAAFGRSLRPWRDQLDECLDQLSRR
jgi:dTDP-4-dehydrorhamnose reductase